jgi:hypothetical protein
VRGRERCTRKRSSLKGGNCEEGCGGDDRGYLQVPRSASLHQTSFEWDQLTLNKGSVGGGRQKKKVSAQTTRDKRGKHGRHTDQDIRAGVQWYEPRSIGARTVQNGRLNPSLLMGRDCLHMEGKRRGKLGSQRCQSHEEGVEQEDLFESTLTSRPPALQYPRSSPQSPSTQKESRGREEAKMYFFRGWRSGKFEIKKKRTYQWMANFRLSCSSHPPLSKTPPTIG